MPAPRKPKKVFVQFAIALVVAGVFGIGALIFGISVIQNIKGNADQARLDADKAKAEAQAELERLKNEAKQQVTAAPAKVIYKVVQATTDINPGQPITKDMLMLVENDAAPPQGTLSMLSQAVGKMVKSPVIQGESLEQSKIFDGAGLVNIKPGMRAITIQVSNIGGLNGSLTAGSKVDVLTTVTKDDKSITKTLLQDTEVIAASNDPAATRADDQSSPSNSSNDNAGAVTLAVTPKQAEMLTLANQLGKFHLTLRNYRDQQTVKMTGADLTVLMTGQDRSGGTKSKALAKPKPPEPNGMQNVNYSSNAKLPAPFSSVARQKFSMQIYRGTGAETVEFQQ